MVKLAVSATFGILVGIGVNHHGVDPNLAGALGMAATYLSARHGWNVLLDIF